MLYVSMVISHEGGWGCRKEIKTLLIVSEAIKSLLLPKGVRKESQHERLRRGLEGKGAENAGVGEKLLYVDRLVDTMPGLFQKRQDLSMLFEIKNTVDNAQRAEVAQRAAGADAMQQLLAEVRALHLKVDELQQRIATTETESESPRKAKMRQEILQALQKQRRLNPSQVGMHVGLSRVRANEYLRELEAEHLVKGVVVNRRKFYMLESDLLQPAAAAEAQQLLAGQ